MKEPVSVVEPKKLFDIDPPLAIRVNCYLFAIEFYSLFDIHSIPRLWVGGGTTVPGRRPRCRGWLESRPALSWRGSHGSWAVGCIDGFASGRQQAYPRDWTPPSPRAQKKSCCCRTFITSTHNFLALCYQVSNDTPQFWAYVYCEKMETFKFNRDIQFGPTLSKKHNSSTNKNIESIIIVCKKTWNWCF